MNEPVDDLAAGNPLLAFLDRVERLADVVARRQRSYDLLGARAGGTIADIGCGAGTAALEMARLISPSKIVGIDISESLIEAAGTRARRAGVEAVFQVGDAGALPFADASLDGYRAERVFQHLLDPVRPLAEAYRVLAPGGRIVLVDQDWDAVLVDSDDLATTRAIARLTSSGIVNSAAGRQYYRLLNDAGFTQVQVFADTHISTRYDEYGFFPELWAQVAEMMGILDAEKTQNWLADQRRRGEQGRFFLAMTHFIGVAVR